MLALSLSTTAFAPPAMLPALRPTALRADISMMAKSQSLPFLEQPAGLDGSMAGDVGFDPLGFSSSGIPLGWMREAELKHGRVCMLAVVGWIVVDSGLRAPGLHSGDKMFDVATSYAAHDVAVDTGGMWFLLMVCGVLEIAGVAGIAATLNGNRVPGDFALTGGLGKTPEKMENSGLRRSSTAASP